ncbi:hypothetical protein Nmel_005822 [Mimus melanotis]
MSTDNPLFHTACKICGEKSYQDLAVRSSGLPSSRIKAGDISPHADCGSVTIAIGDLGRDKAGDGAKN